MKRKLAPIAVFAYNRLDHVRQTIEALEKNKLAKDSDLIIFSDAPRDEGVKEAIIKVRRYLKTVKGFKTVKIIGQRKNLGLAKSLDFGITKVLKKYGKIIILEDDLVASKYFLKYMNDGLDLYENEEKVATIAAYTFPLKMNLPETYFLKMYSSWGWATWERAWKFYERDGGKSLNEIKKCGKKKEFDVNGSYPFFKMLKLVVKYNKNLLGARWYASIFLNDMLTLCPSESLIKNIGFDGSGTNCDSRTVFDSKVGEHEVNLSKIPIVENTNVKKGMERYYRSIFLDRVKSRLKKIVKNPLREFKK